MITPTELRAAATADFPALFLRPWRQEDVPALVEAYADPVLRHRTADPVCGEADGRRWVEGQCRDREAGLRFGFAVLEGETGPLVGGVVLKRPAPGGPSAEVGYWTAAHARGRGVAPRALGALTDWAFETFAGRGLERLDLLHQEDNEASCRVARKCGYLLRGTLPAAPPEYPLSGHLHVRPATRA
ncbi:GNAT family N-acetyltransferase [Streptomyces sp. NPDC012794]|uniref:GNAT family N-acetyltransferase n=1 Tax=Streptomyces sp. NPDC012794 TaxID=3364850 RepID=UPI0036BDA248